MDALVNTVSVAELRARAADEGARGREGAARGQGGRQRRRIIGVAHEDGEGGDAPVLASLEDQLRAMMIKRNDGAKLTGKERKMLAKAEKEGRLLRSNRPRMGRASRKGPPALSAPRVLGQGSRGRKRPRARRRGRRRRF